MNRAAPAKINLSLEILGRREDGFHDLRSLFCPISLADQLEIELADAFSLTCSDGSLALDESNLVVRAARAFTGGELPKVRIHLQKNIPQSAGLGGGSSDAATVLLLLAELFPERHSFAAVSEMAAQLGSDVPFFLHRSAAWCEGRGEKVTPIRLKEKLHLLLFKPLFGVPTPWAFKNLASSIELPGFSYAAQQLPWGKMVNDLERPAFQKYLLLGLIKNWLLAQPQTLGALMSGSGSTLFAVTLTQTDAEELQRGILTKFGPGNWTCVAQSLPLAS